MLQNKRFKIEKPDLEMTSEIEDILITFENTDSNVFLTGKAGTGKSTVLKYFRATTNKNIAVVAPTGVAALNVQGQTIHSFFGFSTTISPERVKLASAEKMLTIQKLDTLVIDEISMVRADLFDCIDIALRKTRDNALPFGGVQIIAIGDLLQLPPVVKKEDEEYLFTLYESPYFFSSNAYKNADFIKKELTKIFRQDDLEFINILNSVRYGDVSTNDLETINLKSKNKNFTKDVIKIVTTNAMAKKINDYELENLYGDEKLYKGQIIDDFNKEILPTDFELKLKIGTRVILLNNEKSGKWVNGDLATVVSLDKTSVKVQLDDGMYVDVEVNEWDNIKFILDEKSRKIDPTIVGKFIQLPLKLAWAITIHKSQGQTYDQVHIDFGWGTFAYGQAYVALSRCKSLKGLSLAKPITAADVKTDRVVIAFLGL